MTSRASWFIRILVVCCTNMLIEDIIERYKIRMVKFLPYRVNILMVIIDDEQQVHLEEMRERFISEHPKIIADLKTMGLFSQMLWLRYIHQPLVSSSLFHFLAKTIRGTIT